MAEVTGQQMAQPRPSSGKRDSADSVPQMIGSSEASDDDSQATPQLSVDSEMTGPAVVDPAAAVHEAPKFMSSLPPDAANAKVTIGVPELLAICRQLATDQSAMYHSLERRNKALEAAQLQMQQEAEQRQKERDEVLQTVQRVSAQQAQLIEQLQYQIEQLRAGGGQDHGKVRTAQEQPTSDPAPQTTNNQVWLTSQPAGAASTPNSISGTTR